MCEITLHDFTSTLLWAAFSFRHVHDSIKNKSRLSYQIKAPERLPWSVKTQFFYAPWKNDKQITSKCADLNPRHGRDVLQNHSKYSHDLVLPNS